MLNLKRQRKHTVSRNGGIPRLQNHRVQGNLQEGRGKGREIVMVQVPKILPQIVQVLVVIVIPVPVLETVLPHRQNHPNYQKSKRRRPVVKRL